MACLIVSTVFTTTHGGDTLASWLVWVGITAVGFACGLAAIVVTRWRSVPGWVGGIFHGLMLPSIAIVYFLAIR